MKPFILTFILIISAIFTKNTDACTTAVISGKYTKDGKPLLWKHRDTWAVNNAIMFFDDGKYSYTGIVNSNDLTGKSIWIGMNSKGFAIMNSASYNLNKDTVKQSGFEGRIMKRALAECGNIDEFEKLLNNLPQPYRLEANYGVIDAQGGAAYFELGNFGFNKIDVNDPAIAPFGYVIRTNYSFTGEIGIGGGYIRYQTADKLFYEGFSTNNFNAQYILQNVSRSFRHSLMKKDMAKEYGKMPKNTPSYFYFKDFIPRTGSASSVVIQGVNKGEDSKHTIMWSIVGFPLTSIVFPIWIEAGKELPYILKYNDKIKDSPLCNTALTLKKECFPVIWGKNEKDYININALINADNSGIMQKIKPYENIIFEKAYSLIKDFEKSKVSQKETLSFYKWLNSYIIDIYKKEFNLSL